MLGVWIVVEVLLGISLAFIVDRYALIVGLVVTLAGVVPVGLLLAYSRIAQSAGDLSAQGMLSTLIFVLVTPVGIATFITGLIRRT